MWELLMPVYNSAIWSFLEKQYLKGELPNFSQLIIQQVHKLDH